MAEFFEFVKTKKEVSVSEGDKNAAKRQVLMPDGRLWIPGQQPFPDSALKSLDLTQAMSIMPR